MFQVKLVYRFPEHFVIQIARSFLIDHKAIAQLFSDFLHFLDNKDGFVLISDLYGIDLLLKKFLHIRISFLFQSPVQSTGINLLEIRFWNIIKDFLKNFFLFIHSLLF